MKRIPYGESDFVKVITGGYYYVDKTSYIPKLEDAASFVHFLRPRRYGKSLFANMLECYYDVTYADRFDDIFGNLYIGQHPTPLHNKYQVLKFGFSAVDPNPANMQDSFNKRLLINLNDFVSKHQTWLPESLVCQAPSATNGIDLLSQLISALGRSAQKLYVVIDEYDNFANTVLADDEDNYMSLCHGTGFFRYFFNVLKDATTANNAALDRIFITGVTPLTLSDVTSGYNIGSNISLDYEYNSMVGFTETEVRQMFEYYRDECGNFHHTVDELLAIIKPWYDNNCFAEKALGKDRMFNSVMTLEFLSQYIELGNMPRNMVSQNVRTDYQKLARIVRIDKTFDKRASVLQRLMTEGEVTVRVIKDEFPLGDLGRAENIVSLMFYMGMLSIVRTELGDLVLGIPNLVMRSQYFSYMNEIYNTTLHWNLDSDTRDELGRDMARRGDAEPMCRYIASGMHSVDSVRDYDYGGEAFVKGFFVSQLGHDNGYYSIHTEYEAGHGYSDILMRPRPEVPHGYVIELKYVKPNAPDSEVEAKHLEARDQLPRYIADKRLRDEAADNHWQLHGVILVFRGWTLERFEEIQ